MLIKLEVSEGDITKIQQGMAVEFATLAEPDQRYHSEISTVDPALTSLTDNEYSESIANTKAVYFYANSIVDNPDNRLRIGMTAQAEIVVSKAEQVLFIPTTTLKREGKKQFVNVLKGDQVEKREVQTGLRNEQRTEILSGLAEGEEVISSELRQGEQVGNSARRVRMF